MKILFLLAPLLIPRTYGSPQPQKAPHEHVVVIVNKANPLTNLSLAELASLYRGKTTTFDDRSRVVLCEHVAARPRFYKSVMEMTESAVSRHWIGVVFSERRAKPPKDFQRADSAQRFTATTRNAICFVELAAIADAGVKVITIGGMPPDDPKYPIR
jgi:hypothetical protein